MINSNSPFSPFFLVPLSFLFLVYLSRIFSRFSYKSIVQMPYFFAAVLIHGPYPHTIFSNFRPYSSLITAIFVNNFCKSLKFLAMMVVTLVYRNVSIGIPFNFRQTFSFANRLNRIGDSIQP